MINEAELSSKKPLLDLLSASAESRHFNSMPFVSFVSESSVKKITPLLNLTGDIGGVGQKIPRNYQSSDLGSISVFVSLRARFSLLVTY